ncbi:hypothetical protein GCM10010412_082430 [Nonomuraea recticatena]|uniref:Uncharacterized protein n=1 Tax=Nonomuraea recticatena TaxID=46178 RepID=A0ABP6FM39_9ACTN
MTRGSFPIFSGGKGARSAAATSAVMTTDVGGVGLVNVKLRSWGYTPRAGTAGSRRERRGFEQIPRASRSVGDTPVNRSKCRGYLLDHRIAPHDRTSIHPAYPTCNLSRFTFMQVQLAAQQPLKNWPEDL